jgi:hypothetical protein
MELRAKTKADTRKIADLTRERGTVLQKVKDRDDELRGKARFLQVCPGVEDGGKMLTLSRILKMKWSLLTCSSICQSKQPRDSRWKTRI